MASYQVRLKEERERLQKKLDQVNKSYDALMRRDQTTGSVCSPTASSNAERTETTSKASTASYLQPTAASSSRAKAAQNNNATTTKVTPTQPRSTVSCASWGFMRHTASSRQRIEEGRLISPPRPGSPSAWGTPGPWGIPSAWGVGEVTEEAAEDVTEDIVEENPSESATETQDLYRPRPPPMSAQEVALLAEETRLEDDSWEDPAASYAVIPSDVGHWLLQEAYSILQEVFHDFCKKHQPALWINEFPGGPREVRFEWSTNRTYCTFWNFPNMPIWGKLFDARLLRNTLCHFSGHYYTYEYEKRIEDAQRFAVAFNDAPRAARLRALRDKLREVAADTLQEVESLGYVAIAPKGHHWEAHHETFLRRFLDSIQSGHIPFTISGFRFSAAIELAVQAWLWQRETQESIFEFLDEGSDQASEEQEQPSTVNIIEEESLTDIEIELLRDG